MRRACGLASGLRMPTVRLSVPHWMLMGAAVKRAEGLGVGLADLPLKELQALEPGVTEAVYTVLTPEASCASRQSFGGTAPEQVRARINDWRRRL